MGPCHGLDPGSKWVCDEMSQIVESPGQGVFVQCIIMKMKLSGKQNNYGPVAQPGHQSGGAIEHFTFISNQWFRSNEVVASSKADSESLVRPVIVAKIRGITYAEI